MAAHVWQQLASQFNPALPADVTLAQHAADLYRTRSWQDVANVIGWQKSLPAMRQAVTKAGLLPAKARPKPGHQATYTRGQRPVTQPERHPEILTRRIEWLNADGQVARFEVGKITPARLAQIETRAAEDGQTVRKAKTARKESAA